MFLRVVAVGFSCVLLVSLPLAGCATNARIVAPTMIDVGPVEGRGLTTSAGEATSGGSWTTKEEVEVEWHGSWWPAIVLEKRSERWLVHYDGYGTEWDEVVGAERIRERRAKPDVDDSSEIEEDPDP